jgi:hypothetical protein
MYNVSNDYIDKMHALTRTDRIYGTLTFKNGDQIALTESDIGSGSVSIARACVDGDELNFGSAIMAELSISIRSEQSRYNFYGSKISLMYGVKLDDNSWEDVPLGIFTVGDATRVGKLVKLLAYDNLQAFDIPFGDTVVTGNAYTVLAELCDLCGVKLGMDVRDFETLPNGLEVLQIDSSNGCKTMRDAIKIVGQLVCGFIIADRDGSIKLRQFSKVPVSTLTENDRYSTMVEDFNCSYVAVQVTGLSGTYSARTIQIREGLTLYIDDAPAWDYGLDTVLQQRVDNIMAYIEDLEYTPCEISMPGNPAYDCGDRLVVSIDGELIETVIMEIDWQFRNKMKISSSGTNVFNLGGQETSTRMLNRETSTNKLEFYNYTNPDDVIIQDNSVEDLCDILFVTINSTNVIFMASIIVDVETTQTNKLNVNTNISLIDQEESVIDVTGTTSTPKNCELKFAYFLNELDKEYYPTYQVFDGKNTITLLYTIEGLESQSSYRWVIKMSTYGGTIKIKEWDAKFILFGQGLVKGDAAWDGKVFVEDAFSPIKILPDLGHTPFSTSVEGSTVTPEIDSIVDNMFAISMRNKISVAGIDSELVDNLVYQRDIISTEFNVSPEGYNAKYIDNVGKFTHINKYYFTGEEFTIDEGKAFKAETDTTQFLRVDDVEVI